MYKVDLHTHSIISQDGGLSEAQYAYLLEDQILNYIAITDHNETTFARILRDKLGEQIIIGEEIKSIDGEIIGLFLEKTIPAGLSAEETLRQIHEQNGIVYIPHPFETFRKGLQEDILERIADQIDIVEVFNGRGKWRHKNTEASAFAKAHNLASAASSDAHCIRGTGKTFSVLSEKPTRKTFKGLFLKASLQTNYAPLYTFLCPAINRIKNKIFV